MSLTEAYSMFEPDGMKVVKSSWESLVSDHVQDPEYKEILGEVPPWGQELLLLLREHHPGSFAHSLRTARTVDSTVLEGDILTGDGENYLRSVPYEKVRLAALLHDVGKLHVPTSILDNPGRPTDDEWRQVQQHVVTGYEAITPHDLIVAQIVGGHHMHQGERSYGYPGAEHVSPDITSARTVVAAADVADALGSRRAYKEPIPPDTVRDIMIREGHFHDRLINRVVDARFFRSPFAPSTEPRRSLRDIFSLGKGGVA